VLFYIFFPNLKFPLSRSLFPASSFQFHLLRLPLSNSTSQISLFSFIFFVQSFQTFPSSSIFLDFLFLFGLFRLFFLIPSSQTSLFRHLIGNSSPIDFISCSASHHSAVRFFFKMFLCRTQTFTKGVALHIHLLNLI